MASKKKTTKSVTNQKNSKEPIYDLVKVIDPHKHMPKKIKESFFECARQMESGQDTYIYWTVGSMFSDHEITHESDYSEEDLEIQNAEDDDDDNYTNSDFEVVDVWLLLNGFKKNDRVMILCWW